MIKNKVFQVEKPWGNFRQFTHNESSTVKILTLNPNEFFSLQTHQKRAEFWHMISGSGFIQIEDTKTKVEVGDELEIGTGMRHRIIAGPKGLQVLEISTGDFDEDDIVRYEDKYGRIS